MKGIGIKMKKCITKILLIFLIVLVLFPIFLIVINSFLNNTEIGLIYDGMFNENSFVSPILMPAYPSLRSYEEVFLYCKQFYIMFWNSIKYVVLIVLGQMLVCLPAAWAFAKLEFPLKRLIYAVYILLMMLPFQVTMLSNYFTLDNLNMLDTPYAFILPTIFSTFPIFIMTRFFSNIPNELIEAGQIDGASTWHIFIYIAIPLNKSGIMAVLILQIIEIWNTIEQPLFFIKNEKYLPLSLFFPQLSSETLSKSFVVAIIMLIPPVLIFLIGRKELEEGIGKIGIEK